MGNIGGNTEAVLQISSILKDEFGVQKRIWTDVTCLRGFLDLSSLGTDSKSLMKRVEDSDYVFLCDYFEPFTREGVRMSTENSRLLIGGEVYEVKLYDDPMKLHQHMEIYLKYMGGQENGGTVGG